MKQRQEDQEFNGILNSVSNKQDRERETLMCRPIIWPLKATDWEAFPLSPHTASQNLLYGIRPASG